MACFGRHGQEIGRRNEIDERVRMKCSKHFFYGLVRVPQGLASIGVEMPMVEKRQAKLLRHLRAELAARRTYLDFWEKQAPIELYSPPMIMLDIRTNLIDAATTEIQVIEQ